MLTLMASALLTVGVADDAADLAALAQKITKAESYGFTSETASESAGGGGGERGGGGGGRGGFGGGTPTPTEGAWKKGAPMKLTVGEVVAYKGDGGQVVFQNAEGEWEVFEMESRFGGFGGGDRGGRGGEGGGERGGRGGERGGEGGGERPEGGDRAGDRDRMRALFTLSRAEAPHAKLADLASKVTEVTKTEKEGAVTFSGKLTEKGTESLSAGGSGFGRRGGGGGGPEMETTGTFSIAVKDGAISTLR